MKITIQWTTREPPLNPSGIFARGTAATALAKRLLQEPDDRLKTLKGVYGDDYIAVTGPEPNLPWVEGLVYMGEDENAPGLYMPTLCTPTVDVHLVVEALSEMGQRFPLFLLPEPACRISLENSRPISRPLLYQLTTDR